MRLLQHLKKIALLFQYVYRWIAGYFMAVFNPALSRSARTLAGVKGMAALGIVGFVLLCIYVVLLIPFTPSIANLKKAKVDQPSILISVDGKRLAAYKRFNREWVNLNHVSPHVANALIATEDHRFYEHHGIDFKRLGGAVVHTLSGRTEGGSTITQQLARNLYPEEIGRERSITRKIKETITALKIEHAYTKKEILETYLNTVPFLYNAFGIEMAARTYFDKPASKLSVVESATLIGMLKGNSYYNPVLNPERALTRRNVVLAQMLKHGVLSSANYETLKRQPIRLDFERQQEALGPAPHFAAHVKKWLIEWADRNDYDIYSDGLKVYTTIDSRLQAAANQAVNRQMDALQAVADVEWGSRSERLIASSTGPYLNMQRRVQAFGYFWNSKDNLVDAFIRETGAYRNAVAAGGQPEVVLAQLRQDKEFMTRLRTEKTRLQAGFVAMDPASGDIKAWVGSRDFNTDQYDHVARAQRQPGSTFKPFVYGAALEQGMSPDKKFIDRAVEIPMEDGTVWRPTDVTPPTGRPMTAREGLIYSKNTITAQVMQEVGPRKTADFARRLGITQSRLDAVPALALGTSPVTPLEISSAYSTIASGGERRNPLLVTRIEDKKGHVLVEFRTEAQRALSREVSEELIDMMRGAINQGTGQAIRTQFGIQADVAGKTGTTQDNTDGWFVLMHPRLVTVAWVGFNDARVTMRSNYWGQGGHNAILVAGDFFRQTLHGRLIDTGAEFPRRWGSYFGASVIGPLLEKMQKALGIGERPPAPPPVESPKKDNASPLDPLQKAIDQAREAERTYQRERRRVEKAIDDIRKVFD